ncbi:MAG: ECF-type sigma factor [Rubrivivax sp.]|nr:ECF-type sigma factor [Rubrivivax sp.]
MAPSSSGSTEEITQWLAALDGPDAGTGANTGIGGLRPIDALFASLYSELKLSARAYMRKEYEGHTLSATALTHEAWFRLTEQTRTQWQSRGHFLGMASIMMRRILVNYAVAKQALKRDAPLVSLTLTEAQQVAGGDAAEVVRVHEALRAFEQVDPRAAKVVELKFFGGLENGEIAEVLGLSLATVKRDWTLARAWLHRELAT